MKRIMAIMLVLLLVISICSPAALAAEEAVSSYEYNQRLNEIHEEVSQLPMVNDGQSDIPYGDIVEIFSESQMNVRATHTQTAELAGILAVHDGLSTLAIAAIGVHGVAAKSEASGRSDYDSYQHTVWNYISAKDSTVGNNGMRIFACDFEWANRLYSRWMDYYENRVEYYRDLYETEILLGSVSIDELNNYALADANDYICTYKDRLQNECYANYASFYQTFTTDNIMDFNNNYVGRSYAASDPSLSNNSMYTMAVNEGEIILDAGDVTGSDYYSIWQSLSMWAC